MNVAIIGASDKPERYAYLALKSLEEYGHTPFLVHPRLTKVEKYPVVKSVAEFAEPIHTVALYVNPKISAIMQDELLALQPNRVIMNPGTENYELQEALEKQGCQVLIACTLVMLKSNQF